MIRHFCLAAVILCSVTAWADLMSVTVKAKVKSFTSDTVTLVTAGKTFKLDRSKIQEKKLVSGETIEVTLEGDDVQKLGLPKN